MAKKIFKLDFVADFDFRLFAILSSLKDYKLCFEICKALNLKFKRQPDLELKDARHNRSEFSYFRHRHTATGEELTLIVNKGSNGALIPELKQIDYFLIIKNHSHDSLERMVLRIREIENVSGVYELNPAEVKSAENFLIFEHSEEKTRIKPH